MKIHVLTCPYDPVQGFDDRALVDLQEHSEVVSFHPQFFEHDGRPYWTLVLATREIETPEAYRPIGRQKGTDWRATLSAQEQRLFDALRAWRNRRAAQEGRPPYVLFTNRQMAQIARRRPATLAELRTVEGVGDSRIEHFGDEVVALIASIEAPDTRNDDDGAAPVRPLGEDPE